MKAMTQAVLKQWLPMAKLVSPKPGLTQPTGQDKVDSPKAHILHKDDFYIFRWKIETETTCWAHSCKACIFVF